MGSRARSSRLVLRKIALRPRRLAVDPEQKLTVDAVDHIERPAHIAVGEPFAAIFVDDERRGQRRIGGPVDIGSYTIVGHARRPERLRSAELVATDRLERKSVA